MERQECLFFVFLFVMINFPCMCSNIDSNVNSIMNDDRQVSKHVANLSDSVNHDEVQKMIQHDGDHYEIRLISWKWHEYWNIITPLVIIIMAGIFKLLFHHTPIVSKHCPESCVLILIGVLVGCWQYAVGGYSETQSMKQPFPKFTSTFFFDVLLPPLVLDSAYSLYDRDFLDNIGSILIFAVFGTLFNVFAIGYGLYFINSLGLIVEELPVELDCFQCLTFASILAAVDPVAVLAIFQEIGVNTSLYFLVFGESLLNDGITVVVYNTMVALNNRSLSGQVIQDSQYLLAFGSFFTVILGGASIGIIVGLICSFTVKFTEHSQVVEPFIVFAMSYFSYIFADTIGWSGIISLICCGIVQKRYAFRNISRKSYGTVKYGVQTLAAFSDCIIFLFLGIETIVREEFAWHLTFTIWTLILCVAFRFVGVFLLSSIVNTFRFKKISKKEQFIIGYGGLRGAVGFSMATILPDSNPLKGSFLATAMAVIYFTIFVQGSTMKFFVQKLKITKKESKGKHIASDINDQAIDHLMAGIESIAGGLHRHIVLEHVINIDRNYVKRLLIRKSAEKELLMYKLQKMSQTNNPYEHICGKKFIIHQNTSTELEVNPENVVVEAMSRRYKLCKKNTQSLEDKADNYHALQRFNSRDAGSNRDERKILKSAFSKSIYGRATLRRTGSLAEHAMEVAKYRESQSQSIILNVLEEQPITGNECKDTDDEKSIVRYQHTQEERDEVKNPLLEQNIELECKHFV